MTKRVELSCVGCMNKIKIRKGFNMLSVMVPLDHLWPLTKIARKLCLPWPLLFAVLCSFCLEHLFCDFIIMKDFFFGLKITSYH